MITKTYKITGTEDALKKLETFLAFFNYNCGHSCLFAMPFDGDGNDVLKVDPPPHQSLKEKVDKIGSYGFNVEIAYINDYGGAFIDKKRTKI